ncbi:MAG: hypothetical protein HOI41_09860, partial [Acidimicrobiaceae bacterium]|nr:hypothetical protein [Acidimicrobiaceae bacterium]
MKPSPKLSLLTTALLVLALFASACSSDPSTEDGSGSDPDSGDTGSQDGSPAGDGSGAAGDESAAQGVTVRIDGPGGQTSDTEIIISLDNASGQDTETVVRETTVQGDPLGTAGVSQLLNRLPDLETQETDQVDFNRPPDTRPRPRPGTTVDQAFPPPADVVAPETASGSLEVLRFQPEGPVDLAPFISVTFNQPMVALSTVSQVENANVPISITPEMPGRWIWLGTKTARFEYEPSAIDRIPAATNYVVEVPAGTTAANGAELVDDVQFEFSTPTPQVMLVTPMHDSLSTEPIFFIRFDQRIDPEAILEAIHLSADGDDIAIRLATGDEINEDTQVSSLAEAALPDRWLALRPVESMPTDAVIQLDIGPNVPSAEGPETSTDTSSYSGRTYGPFRLVDSRCGWDECRPGTPFSLEMSNPIDTDSFTASMVTVEPTIPGMQIGVSWNQITIQGLTS